MSAQLDSLGGHSRRDTQTGIAAEGQDFPQAIVVSTPNQGAPAGIIDTLGGHFSTGTHCRGAAEGTTSPQANPVAAPNAASPAGSKTSRSQVITDTHIAGAAADDPLGDHASCEAHGSTVAEGPTFPRPRWQDPVAAVTGRRRGVADVSVDASPCSPALTYYTSSGHGTWAPFRGTSMAAPLFAGLVADASQHATPTPVAPLRASTPGRPDVRRLPSQNRRPGQDPSAAILHPTPSVPASLRA